ncbi:hypothetical protein PG994_011399 [Apiospora phragmitis]|uniref:Uncharacterized protein n=1 Tax=Apiospora phragmitis TaxID=2905665 RepID=A0ABR1TVC5_9PEZI
MIHRERMLRFKSHLESVSDRYDDLQRNRHPMEDADDMQMLTDLMQEHDKLEADLEAFREKTRTLDYIVQRVLNEVGLEGNERQQQDEDEDEDSDEHRKEDEEKLKQGRFWLRRTWEPSKGR